MERIDEIIQKNYKLIIPITFMFVLFIASLVYYKLKITDNYHIDTEEEVYQYFYDKKYEYTSIISRNRRDEIVSIKPKEAKVNADSTPVYIKNKDVVIFPENMSVVMPTLSCAEYLSPGPSYITLENDIYTLTTKKYNKKLNHYFLYDGKDLYFFIEKVTLKIDKETITLSPYSYIIVRYNKDLSYYDKKSDTFKTIEIGNNNITVENDYYKILVDKDIIDYQGTTVILTSKFDELQTIDKKD